jgi:membrane-associated phospholipid phosphatase
MTDPFAMPGDQPVIDEIELSDTPGGDLSLRDLKPRHVRFARAISNILAPATISVPMILLVALYQASSVARALAYGALTLLFLSIGPFAYILVGVRLGKLSDIDVSRRSERVGPFIFSLISVCLGWFVLILTHGPTLLITVLLLTAVSGLILMIITLWWKISLHASSLAGAATMLTALYGTIMLPSFALLVLVSWSRVVLRRHTPAQVVAGSVLGIALSVVILRLRGW